MQNSGAMAILVVIIVVFVILVTCGCLFGPGLAMYHSGGYHSEHGGTEWRSSARALMNRSGVSMSSKSVNKQGGFGAGAAHEVEMHGTGAVHEDGSGEVNVHVRHPVGQLQPSTYGASGNVKRDLRHPLGMGGSGSEEYVDLRHPVGKMQPSGVSMTSSSVKKQGGFGAGASEEYVDLRHPVGKMQPSGVSMNSKAIKQQGGFGAGAMQVSTAMLI